MAWTKLASRRHLLHRDLLAGRERSHVHGAAIHTPSLRFKINRVSCNRESIENGFASFSLLPGDMNEIIIAMNPLHILQQNTFFY